MRTTQLISASQTMDLTQAGTIEIANVSGGQSPVYILTDEELQSVDMIQDLQLRNNVMNAMYRIQPGERRSLSKAKFEIILGANAKAFIAYNGPAKVNGTALLN